MPATKVTMVFRQTSNVSGLSQGSRVAGWTESFYTAAPIPLASTILRDIRKTMDKRAALLGIGAAITSFRVQRVDPTGVSRSFGETRPGGAGVPVDIPQMCMYCNVRSNSAINVGKLYLHGIPDGLVVEGEYKPTEPYATNLEVYLNYIRGWAFSGQNFDETEYAMVGVDANGAYTAAVDLPFTAGQKISILRASNANQRSYSGVFRILNTTSARAGVLKDWVGVAMSGGVFQRFGLVFPAIDEARAVRIIVKKVGRPSDVYRGRASARR